MENKPLRPVGVQKGSGNRCMGKLLKDVYYKNETVNKKEKEDLRPKKLGIQYRR